ncbi:helix-turn-helix domain-containing protein [Brucella intermedia]|uniref:helix-turn-helix domain-containing protein n=1 Tax=Brucella intermedia TaxID=94625 RepID=UPI00235E3737|nr:helix-turn-helix domain-containing protein [Brucella intermedia]
MVVAAYSSRTERAARAYLAKKKAAEADIKPVQIETVPETEPEPEINPVDVIALEAVRQFDETGTVSAELKTYNIPVKAIIKAVCHGTGITPRDILGHSRFFPVKTARHKAICIAALARRQSVIFLGREFKRDHTTILATLEKHGIRREPIRKKRELTEDDIFAIHEMRNQGMGRHKIASLMRMGTARLDEILSGKVGVTIKSRVVELFEQGHDTFDIAQIMGLTEPQVCDRLHQARERARYNRTKRAA